VRIRHLGNFATLALFFTTTAMAAGKCQLQQLGVLPVDMQGLRPVVATKINGAEARFILDTGSFYSSMSPDAASQYHLPVGSGRTDEFYVEGLGGSERGEVATVGKFEFLGVDLPNVQFIVIDQSRLGNVAGLLGQNLLRISDVEYDLSNGAVRFIKPVDCNDQPLAYWAVNTTYSFVNLHYTDRRRPELRTEVMINGHRMTAEFDTGAGRSWLSLQAAERAGITPDSPGVKSLGIAYGIGPAPARVWSAPVDTFQVGGEKVTHAHLLIGDFEPKNPDGSDNTQFPDMLLGDDYFLSHRIYVAYSQNKLYFSYNGAPLFNLNVPGLAAGTGKVPPAGGATSQASSTQAEEPGSNAPTDADGFRRRGMAYAATREFDRALADLTRACELAPGSAQNRLVRGEVYTRDGQFKLALQDFDSALTLQPNDMQAHLARAALLRTHPDPDPTAAAAEAKSDLDAVSRLAEPAANVRLQLGSLYGGLGDYPDAIGQIDQWLHNHQLASDQAIGLNARCWQRATANRDLREALADCNRALSLQPRAEADTGSHIRRDLAPQDPAALDSRGLVYLRLGNPRDAVRDYDSALDTDPNMSNSLYGRGLAELRLGEKARAQDDLAAAEKLDAQVARRFASMGLAP
jgi:tetratricopeptide (TPR) repeat protein/predicted aspartyl protease